MNSYHIESLQPKTNFTLHMAAMTCHGEGIRSEGHPIIASYYLEQMGRNASEFFTFRQPGRHPSGPFGTKVSPDFTESGATLESITPLPQDLFAGSSNKKWLQHTWVIVLVILGVILWTIIIIAICFCRRQRRVKQRCPRGNPSDGKALGGNAVTDSFRMKKSSRYAFMISTID